MYTNGTKDSVLRKRKRSNSIKLRCKFIKVLETGASGFIGYHRSEGLFEEGHKVFRLDNWNHYYDLKLKLDRLKQLGIDAYKIAMDIEEVRSKTCNFFFFNMSLEEKVKLNKVLEDKKMKLLSIWLLKPVFVKY